jgi:transposase
MCPSGSHSQNRRPVPTDGPRTRRGSQDRGTIISSVDGTTRSPVVRPGAKERRPSVRLVEERRSLYAGDKMQVFISWSMQMGRPPRSGALFVFFGKRRDALRILFADGRGLCLFSKRLDRGTFRPPPVHEAGATSIALDERALDDLLDGIDIEAEVKPPRRRAARVH